MATISETAVHNHRHAGIWHRVAHALGKLWAKMIALPEAPSGAARRKEIAIRVAHQPRVGRLTDQHTAGQVLQNTVEVLPHATVFLETLCQLAMADFKLTPQPGDLTL